MTERVGVVVLGSCAGMDLDELRLRDSINQAKDPNIYMWSQH